MNRKIIFGVFLSAAILVSLPAVPAVESNRALDSNSLDIINELKEMSREIKDLQINDIDCDKSNERFKNIEQEELKDKINGIYEDLTAIGDPPAQPQFIIILTILKTILQLISLIITFGYVILSIVMSLVYFIISFIISLPVVIVLSVLRTLINIIDKLIETIRNIISPDGQVMLT